MLCDQQCGKHRMTEPFPEQTSITRSSASLSLSIPHDLNINSTAHMLVVLPLNSLARAVLNAHKLN